MAGEGGSTGKEGLTAWKARIAREGEHRSPNRGKDRRSLKGVEQRKGGGRIPFPPEKRNIGEITLPIAGKNGQRPERKRVERGHADASRDLLPINVKKNLLSSTCRGALAEKRQRGHRAMDLEISRATENHCPHRETPNIQKGPPCRGGAREK